MSFFVFFSILPQLDVRLAKTHKEGRRRPKKFTNVKTHKDKDHASDAAHQNILHARRPSSRGPNASVTLCARVTLMRKVYLKFPGADYWDKLDKRLAKIGGRQTRRRSPAFCKLLDGKTHDPIDETAVGEFQQGFDDLIDIAVINTATLVQGGSV
ncbi:hypothetical protein B0H14DRAFT_3882278 [Mycena olivaceomarginata]|nr:hypothetical protein B0H14DRAFT_3882278 [Mycena olivaceomarginata]